ncbi:MAG: hypothetical protein ACHQRM_06610 [Bacteroidia bacterium]
MNLTSFFLRNSFLSIMCLLLALPGMAQKSKKNDKLEKRMYDIEVKETTTEGKKYEKGEVEFTPKEIVCDYFESKLKIQTMHYKTLKDSSYTEEGDQLKYFKVRATEKGQKEDEQYVLVAEIKGKDITGTISLMKGDKAKRTWEFEGTQKN